MTYRNILEKIRIAFPQPVSDAGHYCATNIVGWLGIGTNNLVTIPTTDENEMDLGRLEKAVREALTNGKKIAAIIATLGTTDAFLRSSTKPMWRPSLRRS